MSKKKTDVTLYPLSLNGDTFNAFKSDFDQMLRQLLTEMEKRESEEATISVKMAIKLEPDTARDYLANGYDGTRDIIKPSFKHEISTMMQVKNKKSGNLGDNMELVWDKSLHQYVMRPIDNGQVSFFDGYDKQNQQEENQEAAPGEELPALPAGDPIALPPAEDDYVTVDDNIIDVEVVPEATNEEPVEEVTPAPAEDVIKWLSNFLTAKLKILEATDTITVRSDDGKVALSTAVPVDSYLYCHADILKPFVGNAVSILAHYEGDPENPGEITGVTIWSNDEDCAIAYVGMTAEEPEEEPEFEPVEVQTEEQDDYDYETPDEE